MKLNALISLGSAALIAGVGINAASAKQPSEQLEKEISPASLVAQSHMGAMQSHMGAMKSGHFKAGEHPTEGMFSIETTGGRRYLVLDDAFKTVKGPDVFVILVRSATPVNGIKRQDYVSLGRLQHISGHQRYRIPANVNLANYGSVAIWCRQFNATFGYAPL